MAGFILFCLSMAALALMSTTRESRAQAAIDYAWLKPYADKVTVFCMILLASFFI